MGLLNQIIAGTVSTAANTYGDILKQENAAKLQSERDTALDIKARSLSEFQQNLKDASADSGMVDSYGAKMSNAELAEYRRTMTENDEEPMSQEEWKRRQETDKNMLVNNEEVTVGEVADIRAGNKAREAVESDVSTRKEGMISQRIKNNEAEILKAYVEEHPDAASLPPEKLKQLIAADAGTMRKIAADQIGTPEYTEEEKLIIESWAGNKGELTRIKDIEAGQKKEIKQLELDQKKEIEREKIEAANSRAKEHNELLLALKSMGAGNKAEEKALDFAQRRIAALNTEEAKNEKLTDAQIAEYNKYAKITGDEQRPAVTLSKIDAKAQAEKEASDLAGWFSTDGKDFKKWGGKRESFVKARTAELMGQPQGLIGSSTPPTASTAKPVNYVRGKDGKLIAK